MLDHHMPIRIGRHAASFPARLETFLTACTYRRDHLPHGSPVAVGQIEEWHHLCADVLGHHEERLRNVQRAWVGVVQKRVQLVVSATWMNVSMATFLICRAVPILYIE